MTEKWEEVVDDKKDFRAIFHNPLVAKLHAYGLIFPALKLMLEFLRNCRQGAKSGMSYSIWEETLSAVTQDSILGLLLFNNFLCDQSLKQDSHYFTKYVDDAIPCVIDET